jgi:chitin disaccharide deacetylase
VSARRLIVTADDFGLSPAVNEAVERAHREGILTSASLMVAGPAAADAVDRARRLPRLAVGLHLVAVEGPACLPGVALPDLVDASGWFPPAQLRLAVAYGFSRRARAQLAAEIRAQFAAFAATGLTLDHADAHKHMHLHPVVGSLLIRIGREFGLRAVRVPAEPGGGALALWCAWLRMAARLAGLAVNDRVYGLRDSGRMDLARVQAILDRLPSGLSEIYAHPATEQDALLARLMPGYAPRAEFEALLAARLPPWVTLTAYGAEAEAR